MKTYTSVCPYDCPDACGLVVTVDDDRVVSVAGDGSHPFTRGTLCPKMAHYERTVHSPRRLITPLKRTGPKGSGQFAPISWEQALAEIAERWKAIMADVGAEAILPYSYAGTMGIVQHDALHGLFYHLGASELDRTICAPAKGRGFKDVMGNTMPTAPQEAQDSDCIFLWSLHMLATNIHFRHDVEAARAKGAVVWCIDTYRHKTADIVDHVVVVRPGTDGALALGMMYVLDRDGLADKAFLDRHVLGWDELKAAVLPKYTPAETQRLTGVPADVVVELAHAYGQARAPFIRLGSGQSRYRNGAMTTRLITCLPAIVGAWGKKGAGLLTSASASKAYNKEIVTHSDWKQPGKRIVNMCCLGQALTEDDSIRSLFVYSSNPACTAPDQNQVLKGLCRDDLFTVVHERFMTDTARYADLVLPATTSLEHDDAYYSYGNYTIQCGYAAIPPVGQSRSNWHVACDLAHALGIKDKFYDRSERELVEALIASTTKWPLPVDRQRLLQGLPTPLPLPDDYQTRFGTPSGKIEIRNEALAQPLPDYMPLAEDDGTLAFVNGPDMRILDSSFNERDELTAGHIMDLFVHPDDAARYGLTEGQTVTLANERGQADFTVVISDRTVPGQVVSEGVWWRERIKGKGASVNVLTSQRLTDEGAGSTFYDVRVSIVQ
ncbi:molybdopterin-containing oxidoreductase family protein [Megasphaera elsdenii]|uniref:molybdopterin-containing oxidoreductase family protein n=1 Tax=Megasphaera elsdenii TaxID=907 RepID=UPI00091C3AAA|nr:molybdopterin-dependent oxidoreductase [Megasphaera elsdenii]SHK40082.1 Anaerobic selenocysteine-containing dehydrogenase [Megasphaera elsdenii]